MTIDGGTRLEIVGGPEDGHVFWVAPSAIEAGVLFMARKGEDPGLAANRVELPIEARPDGTFVALYPKVT